MFKRRCKTKVLQRLFVNDSTVREKKLPYFLRAGRNLPDWGSLLRVKRSGLTESRSRFLFIFP
jgi:hypothetical protein